MEKMQSRSRRVLRWLGAVAPLCAILLLSSPAHAVVILGNAGVEEDDGSNVYAQAQVIVLDYGELMCILSVTGCPQAGWYQAGVVQQVDSCLRLTYWFRVELFYVEDGNDLFVGSRNAVKTSVEVQHTCPCGPQ